MATRVTEIKRIKIDHGCKTNPVYFSWAGTDGSRNYWLFDTVQSEALITENGGTFEPYTADLENSRGQVLDVSVFAQPQLVVYGLVLSEDLQGLKTILYSPNVEVLVNPDTWQTDGCKWQVYRPEPGSFRIIDTDETRNQIEITFNKPYINNVQQ